MYIPNSHLTIDIEKPKNPTIKYLYSLLFSHTKKSIVIALFITVLVSAGFLFFINIRQKNLRRLQLQKGYYEKNEGENGNYFATKVPIGEPDPAWHPGDKFGTANQPEIAGESGMLIDLNDDKLLFEKNSTKKLKIASLTKVMTAVLVLEHANLNQVVTVSEKAATIGENSMGITAGEQYTVNELMYGLLLPSGNDSAYALAEGTAGDVDTFISWMNLKAKELGLQNTRYYDPSGLDDRTTSTAEDLAKLTRYALKSDVFKRYVKTIRMEESSETHKELYLENQTNLLTTYPGVAGVKTGYTEEAGLCLITYASNGGHNLVGVVLDSIDRKGDMILMLDHGFSTVGVQVEHHLLDH
jgi:D-alanyl-D-alanine carboxypeptidase